MNEAREIDTPIATTTKLDMEEAGASIEQKVYMGMIGSLLYLTASRPDIVFSVELCTKFQANPKESHLKSIKRIFKYLKGTTDLGLWYSKGSNFNLVGYADADYVGYLVIMKCTTCMAHFLGTCLISWSTKKQNFVALSTVEAEYMVVGSCGAQLLWIKQQLLDFGLNVESCHYHITHPFVFSPPTIILIFVDGIAHVLSLNGLPHSPTVEENRVLVLPLEASSEWESREHATIRVALDRLANWSSVSHNHFLPFFTELCPMAYDGIHVPLSIDTPEEISLANIKPTKGNRHLTTLNRKCVSNSVSESYPPIANPSISGVRVPQTRQKRRQAEADLASAMEASKRTRASTRTLPTTPDIAISDDDIVLSRVRRGKYIPLKSSCSKPMPTPKAMKSYFSKPSLKFVPKVASLISSSCSLSGSNAKNLTSPILQHHPLSLIESFTSISSQFLEEEWSLDLGSSDGYVTV
ncbi:hypothetical protein KY284_001217 [Solanum tuberosum]|nr:hypothetical protein KY284_001217 [Solanum tuberosum]